MVEELLKSGKLPCLVATSLARARDRHGRRRPGDPGRVAEVGHRAACSGSGAPATSSARSRRAASSPSSAPTCSSARWSPSGCATGEIEETVIPRNPLDVLAQHLVSMVADDEWEVDEVERAGHRDGALLRPLARAARERPRHARRPLPVGEVRRAAPADRLGPHGRHRARAQGRPPARGHQRRDDPRPRPLRRPPARRPPGRRARRGDGLRGPSRTDLPARGDHLADRGDHPRPRDRHPGARRPGGGAVLARRRGRPSARARPGDRRLLARGGRQGPRAARRRVRPRPARGPEPRRLPARAAGRDPGRALRRDARGREVPRRDRRLAPLRSLAVRRARARRLGAGALGADPRRARPRGRRDLVRRRDRRPPARRRRASRRRRW